MKRCLFLLILFPVFAFANEQQDAIQSCMKAEAKAMHFYASRGIKREDFSSLCKIASRSKAQWDCVNQSLDNGNAPVFSEDQCFRTDQKTIKIGVGEEKNAIAFCQESLAIAHKKNVNLWVDCDPIAMNHNADEWACMKNMLANDNDFSYSASQCIINTDAQRENYY